MQHDFHPSRALALVPLLSPDNSSDARADADSLRNCSTDSDRSLLRSQDADERPSGACYFVCMDRFDHNGFAG